MTTEELFGVAEPGNIDLTNQTVRHNEDGSVSTIKSTSVNIDGQEVLLDTVDQNGTQLTTQEAIRQYETTGKHLGKFDSVESANKYAQSLHEGQEKLYPSTQPNIMTTEELFGSDVGKEQDKIGFWENIQRGGWGGFFDKATLGVKPMVQAAQLYGTTQRLQRNTYLQGDAGTKEREADQQQIVDYITNRDEEQRRGLTVAASVGNIAGDMLPFMAEFVYTGGLATLGKKAATRAVLKLAGEVAGREAAGMAEKFTARQATAKVAGWATEGAIRTALTPHEVIRGYIQNRMPDIQISPEGQAIFKESENTPFKAAYKAIANQWVEMASETTGEPMGKAAVAIGKKLLPDAASAAMGRLRDAWVNKVAGRTVYDFARKMGTITGKNSILEEMGEERLGDLMKVGLGVDDKQGSTFEKIGDSLYPGARQLWIEAIAFSIPAGGQLALSKALGEKGRASFSRKEVKDYFGIEESSSAQRDQMFDAFKSAKEQGATTQEAVQHVIANLMVRPPQPGQIVMPYRTGQFGLKNQPLPRNLPALPESASTGNEAWAQDLPDMGSQPGAPAEPEIDAETARPGPELRLKDTRPTYDQLLEQLQTSTDDAERQQIAETIASGDYNKTRKETTARQGAGSPARQQPAPTPLQDATTGQAQRTPSLGLRETPSQVLPENNLREILRMSDLYRPRDKYIQEFTKYAKGLKDKGINYFDAYHVTSADTKDFTEKGIKGSESDYIGKATGNLRPSSVYMFLEPHEISKGFSGITGIVSGAKTVNVVHLKIPIEQIKKLHWDSNYNVTFGTRSSIGFEGDINRSWIDSTSKYDIKSHSFNQSASIEGGKSSPPPAEKQAWEKQVKQVVKPPSKEMARQIISGSGAGRPRDFILGKNETYQVVDEVAGTKRVLAKNLTTGKEEYYHVSKDGIFAERNLPDNLNAWAEEKTDVELTDAALAKPEKAGEGEKSKGVASVKVMITNADRQTLADLGYSKEQVSAMKPEEAGRIIDGKTPPKSKGVAEKPAKETANKIFTEDKRNAALERIKQRIKDKGSFFKGEKGEQDVEGWKDLVDVAGYHFEKGVRDFTAWSTKVIEDVGDWVKPHLQKLWDEVSGKPEPKVAKEKPETEKAEPKKEAGGDRAESKGVVANILYNWGRLEELEYDVKHIQEESDKADAAVEENPEKVRKIISGNKNSTDISTQALKIAYYVKMEREKNIPEILWAAEHLVSGARESAQNLNMEKRLTGDPLLDGIIQLTDNLIAAGFKPEKEGLGLKTVRTAKQVAKDAVKQTVKNAKEAVNKADMNMQNALDFIESLRCK